MTVSQALDHPTATIIFLVEATAGLWVRNWIVDGVLTNTYKFTTSLNVYAVKVNNSTVLTQQASAAAVDANNNSWYHDGTTLYVRTTSIFANTVQAFVKFYFSNIAKTFDNIYYDPRFESAPAISLRIEKNFGGVSQIGGGTVSFANQDHYFYALQELQWNAGTVTIKIGVDLPPDRVMAFADYETLATWVIDDWENGDEFKLKLVEPKSRSKRKLPNTFYDLATYPSIDESAIGKPIQIAYGTLIGVNPILIDSGAKKFKVAGHAIKSFDGLRIKNGEVWENATFTTTDLTLAEFTLSTWTDEQLAVDFTGKATAGVTIDNASDIVKDILATAGETNVNTASFTTAKNRLDIGTDRNGNRVVIRKPSVYIDSVREVSTIIGEINNLVGSFLFSDGNGQYSYGVFEPTRGEDLQIFDDQDIKKFADLSDISAPVSKVQIRYQINAQEEIEQTTSAENTGFQHANSQNSAAIKDFDLNFFNEEDAEYWAQRYLIMTGNPFRKFTITVSWRGMLLLPGDQIHLVYAKRSIDEILEVLEIKRDFRSKEVTLILGNLRGFKDTPGFWVDDADVLPARFAALTGYGVGSLVWNPSWDDEIKTWARQNVGYWTDENGFANSADPDSFIPSAWV